MNTGPSSRLDQTRRGDYRSEGEAVPLSENRKQGVIIDDASLKLARMYLICLDALAHGKPTIKHHDVPETQSKHGQYFLEVRFDWKLAIVLGAFLLWILKNLVMPLLK